VALILVLSALTLLTVMLTEFQASAGADLSSAIEQRDAVKAEYAAKSAINLSRLLIAAEPSIRASIAPIVMMLMQTRSPPQLPVWKFADSVLGAFNDEAGMQAFSTMSGLPVAGGEHLGMEGASFQLSIVDEDSKINFNVPAKANSIASFALQDQLLLGMFAGSQYDAFFQTQDAKGDTTDRLAQCAAIVDWTDPDQNLTNCDPSVRAAAQQNAGSEDSYYQQLKVPYQRKNAAFDSLDELHLVRGVSDDFWNTFIDPDPEDSDKRNVTVWGQGGVNVNTANPQTIVVTVCSHADLTQPSLCTDPAQLSGFLSAMALLKSVSQNAPLFPTADDFVSMVKGASKNPMFQALMTMLPPDMQFSPVKLTSEKELKDSITTESKIFSIYATGRVGSGKRETTVHIHTVVDFRQAPPIGQATLGQIQDAVKDATAQIRSSAGGNVIYYRMD
jgi:general secretion pathway protein K